MRPADVADLLAPLKNRVRLADGPRGCADAYLKRADLNGVRVLFTLVYWMNFDRRLDSDRAVVRAKRLSVWLPNKRLFAYADPVTFDWNGWHNATTTDLVELRLMVAS